MQGTLGLTIFASIATFAATSVFASEGASITTSASDPADCNGGRIKASLIALKLTGGVEAKSQAVEQLVAGLDHVTAAKYDADSKLLAVLAPADGTLSADRLIESLAAAGYEASEATELETKQALGILQSANALVIRRPKSPKLSNYPDTRAGRRAHAFVEAFNSGDPEKVQAAAEKHRTKSAQESTTMDERLEQYKELYQSWGRLAVRSYQAHDDGSLTVRVKPDRGFDGLDLTFVFGEDEGKIEEIRITPAILPDESSDDATEAIEGKVTVLSESLAPLREHFNANKDKYRFIAILSPT